MLKCPQGIGPPEKLETGEKYVKIRSSVMSDQVQKTLCFPPIKFRLGANVTLSCRSFFCTCTLWLSSSLTFFSSPSSGQIVSLVDISSLKTYTKSNIYDCRSWTTGWSLTRDTITVYLQIHLLKSSDLVGLVALQFFLVFSQ